MVSRQRLLNILREHGYSFKRKGKRNEIWRQSGTGKIQSIPTNKRIPPAHVKIILTRMGLETAAIERFVNGG